MLLKSKAILQAGTDSYLLAYYNIFVKHYGSEKAHNLHDKRGTDLDIKEGTDFIVDGIRTDLTANIWGKDNLALVCDSGVKAFSRHGEDYNFVLGVRTGNARRAFKTPVVVLGVDCGSADDIKACECEIYDSIEANIDELTMQITDVWDDFSMVDTTEREDYGVDARLVKNHRTENTRKPTKEVQAKLDFRNLIPEPHTDLDVGCEL